MLKNSVSESWLTSRQRPVGYWGTGRSEDDGRLIVDLFSLHLPNLFASFSLFSRFPEVNVIVNCVCSNLSVKCRQTKTQNGLFSFVKTFVKKKNETKRQPTNQPTNQADGQTDRLIDRETDRETDKTHLFLVPVVWSNTGKFSPLQRKRSLDGLFEVSRPGPGTE